MYAGEIKPFQRLREFRKAVKTAEYVEWADGTGLKPGVNERTQMTMRCLAASFVFRCALRVLCAT